MHLDQVIVDGDIVRSFAERYGYLPGMKPSVLVSRNVKLRGLVEKACEQKSEGLVRRVIVDSGTYGENAGGYNTNYNEAAYLADIKHWATLPIEWFAAYDRDFNNPGECQEIFSRMRRELRSVLDSSGVPISDKLVGVVHDGKAPVDEFEWYQANGAKVIAIGSTCPISIEQAARIAEVRRETGVLLHVFGDFSPKRMKLEKPDSADSSTSSKSIFNGVNVAVWDEVESKIRTVSVRDSTVTELRKWEQYFKDELGYTIETLIPTRNRLLRFHTGFFAIQKYQEYLTRNYPFK